MGICNCKDKAGNTSQETELSIDINSNNHRDNIETNNLAKTNIVKANIKPKYESVIESKTDQSKGSHTLNIDYDEINQDMTTELNPISFLIEKQIDMNICEYIEFSVLYSLLQPNCFCKNNYNGFNSNSSILINDIYYWMMKNYISNDSCEFEHYMNLILNDGLIKDLDLKIKKILKELSSTDLLKNNLNSQEGIEISSNRYEDLLFLNKPIKFNNGDIYFGSLNSSLKKEGFGFYLKPNQSIYKGFFINDQPKYFGIYIDSDTDSLYIGEFNEGEPKGKGEYYLFASSKEFSLLKKNSQKPAINNYSNNNDIIHHKSDNNLSNYALKSKLGKLFDDNMNIDLQYKNSLNLLKQHTENNIVDLNYQTREISNNYNNNFVEIGIDGMKDFDIQIPWFIRKVNEENIVKKNSSYNIVMNNPNFSFYQIEDSNNNNNNNSKDDNKISSIVFPNRYASTETANFHVSDSVRKSINNNNNNMSLSSNCNIMESPKNNLINNHCKKNYSNFKEHNNQLNFYINNNASHQSTNSSITNNNEILIYYYYKGEFKNSEQNGFGIEWYYNNCYYEGTFNKGEKNGEGVFFWDDGSFYKGNFVNGEIKGIGLVKLSDRRSYSGYFVKGKLEGEGYYQWQDGSFYKGEYKNFLKHGIGSYSYNSNQDNVYEGDWFGGQQHGEGSFKSKEKHFIGKWRHGKNIKQEIK